MHSSRYRDNQKEDINREKMEMQKEESRESYINKNMSIDKENKQQTKRKNQLLLSEEQIRKYEEQHKKRNTNI